MGFLSTGKGWRCLWFFAPFVTVRPVMRPVILIPSRLAATRLPNKPLADIHGLPMIVHVYKRAVEAGIAPVWVAAGDAEIAAAIKAAGGDAVLTDPNLPSGSDRIWAALGQLPDGKNFDVIVNLQGDLPGIEAETLRAILKMMENPAVDIGTAAAPIADLAEAEKPNIVKIAMAGQRALYFSRSPIPHGGPYWHHIGIYAYRRTALEKFIALPPSPLEKTEKLEQLRALEAGMRMDVALVKTVPIAIDTPEDLENARRVLGKSV